MIIISFVIIGLIIGLPILAIVLIERTVDKKEEARSKIEAEKIAKAREVRSRENAERKELTKLTNLMDSFYAWWLNSRFNSFIVLEKRTPMHFNGNRYMVVRHTITNECYNLAVNVTTYFNNDVGANVYITDMTDIKYDYITEEAFAEFTKNTGICFSRFDLRRWAELYNKYELLEEDETL